MGVCMSERNFKIKSIGGLIMFTYNTQNDFLWHFHEKRCVFYVNTLAIT